MCEENDLNYNQLWELKRGINKQTKDGWKLAAPEEVTEMAGSSGGLMF